MKRFWCKEDELSLMAMAAEGKTNSEIAEALGRSKTSVAHKRARLFAAAELTELNEIKADDELEDRDEQGSTEIERELEYTQQLFDKVLAAINANAEILDSNMAALMERVNELSQRQTALEDEVAELKKRTDLNAENVALINIYFKLGPLYRLFHSFRKFREVRNRG